MEWKKRTEHKTHEETRQTWNIIKGNETNSRDNKRKANKINYLKTNKISGRETKWTDRKGKARQGETRQEHIIKATRNWKENEIK